MRNLKSLAVFSACVMAVGGTVIALSWQPNEVVRASTVEFPAGRSGDGVPSFEREQNTTIQLPTLSRGRSAPDAMITDGGIKVARPWTELEAIWSREQADSEWATNVDAYLSALISPEAVDFLDVLELDCRETLCRISVPASALEHRST